MQENNNFDAIITTWRRLSGEIQTEPTFTSMSGDSQDHQPHKKHDPEATLLMPDRPKAPAPAPGGGGGTDPAQPTSTEEKQEFIQRDKEVGKEAAGDTNNKDYLDDTTSDFSRSPDSRSESQWDKDKLGDKVDSVYLRPPPPHKARSATSTTVEDEGCGFKCLYYTLQCCDCVIM